MKVYSAILNYTHLRHFSEEHINSRDHMTTTTNHGHFNSCQILATHPSCLTHTHTPLNLSSTLLPLLKPRHDIFRKTSNLHLFSRSTTQSPRSHSRTNFLTTTSSADSNRATQVFCAVKLHRYHFLPLCCQPCVDISQYPPNTTQSFPTSTK